MSYAVDIDPLYRRATFFTSPRSPDIPLTIRSVTRTTIHTNFKQTGRLFSRSATTTIIGMTPAGPGTITVGHKIPNNDRVYHDRERHTPRQINMRRQRIPADRVRSLKRSPISLSHDRRRYRSQCLAFPNHFSATFYALAQLQRRTSRKIEYQAVVPRAVF